MRILTAGVNPLDNMIIKGEVKMIVPYKMPLVMGNEFVGIIEKVGADVKDFRVGDRVYGRMPLAKPGAFAEYAAINADAVAVCPDYLTDIEAACIPLTALTALRAFELIRPTAGDTVFISGGTGSFGAMAIPIAKSYGLNIITNGSASGADRVMSLGADRFIDYKKEDYSQVLSGIDCVIDTLGDREPAKEFAVLKDGGKLVSLRAMPNGEFAARFGMSAVKRLLFSLVGKKIDKAATARNQKYYFIFVHEDGAGLRRISEIFDRQRIKASVDGIFELSDVNKALKKIASGGSSGKTVLHISDR